MKSWRVLDRAIFILLFGVVPCLQLSFFENPSLHPKQLLSLLTVSLMFLGLTHQSILVPKSQIFWIGTGLLGIAMAMSFAFGPNQVSSWPFWLESLCSLAAYFYFFRHFSVGDHATRLLTGSLLFAAVVNLIFVGYQLMTFDFAAAATQRQFAGLFGENNLLSQFFAIAVVAIGTSRRGRTIRGLDVVAISLLQVMLIAIVVLFQSRSVLLGLTLWFVVSWFMRDRDCRFCWVPLVRGAGGVFLGLALHLFFGQSVKGIASVGIRSDLYVDTLRMLLELPFGVGRDQFQFAILSYSSLAQSTALRGELFSDPHSELLSLAVDYGVVAGGLVFLALVQCVRLLKWRDIFERRPVEMGILLCLLPEFLFQFPLHVYPSRMVVISALAAVSSEVWGAREFVSTAILRAGAWIIAPVCGLAVVTLTFANVSGVRSVQAGDISGVVRACQWNPWDWRMCGFAIDGLTYQHEWGRARELVIQQSQIRPLNEWNRRRLDRIELDQGQADDNR